MKYIALVLALIFAVPAISAWSLSYTGYTDGLFSFDGYNNYQVSNQYATTGFYNDLDSAYVYGNSADFAFGVQATRPQTVTQHYDPNGNDNYRSVSYGDWDVNTVQAQCYSCGFGFATTKNYAATQYARAHPEVSPVSTWSGVGYIGQGAYAQHPSGANSLSSSFGSRQLNNAYGGYSYANTGYAGSDIYRQTPSWTVSRPSVWY